MAGLVAFAVGVPWPVMLVLAGGSLLLFGLRHCLNHRENMRALDKARGDQVPDVMRSIAERGRFWRPPDRPPPP